MKLKDLFEHRKFELIQGSLEQQITSLEFDSRQVKKGSLFFCIKGYQTDGHLYIQQAVDLGASAIILEKESIVPQYITVVKVDDTRKYLPAAASLFFGNPSEHLKLVGITGTNGKTTITYLLKAIMQQAQMRSGLIGTISNYIGDVSIETKRTTPESTDFQQMLKRMVDEKVKACVMEVSSHSLALHRVDHTTFHTGVFTNLTEDHLDFHPSMEDYYQSKKKLFHMTNFNVINVDDPYGKRLFNELKIEGIDAISYGIDNACDLHAEEVRLSTRGVVFRVVGMGMNHMINLNIPGKFSIYNALAAIGAARYMEINPQMISIALENVNGVPGRLERIHEVQSFSVIVDYAHTPDALENVLNTIKNFTKGRVITVFGCGGDRDMKKRPLMGEVAGRLSNYTIITSDNPRSEDPYSILNMIEEGITSTQTDYQVIENRREAIKEAIHFAKPNDVILIAGKGHETTQTIGHVTMHFDDRETVRELAREEGIQ